MKYLKVNLWGEELGRLVLESNTRRIYFMYNPNRMSEIPDIIPMYNSREHLNIRLPIYGDDRPLYQGLPPFIADSLPDSWGNTLFEKWVKDNKIPRNKVNPLYKLMFIGTRGMGALEYEPCDDDLNKSQAVNIKALYDISLKILEDREQVILTHSDQLNLQALLAVGTSAGGRQMKAIIAVNNTTGEIRSGQTDGLKDFDYCILKFGNKDIPIAEIEMAYYEMAVASGIKMEECRLLPVEGINHFLTHRFDRKNGKKIFVQTLAAINPEAHSYEDLLATGRELLIAEPEIEQLFAQMVFNVLANNTDDHNKNFSFLLGDDGAWHIAPAYDMTFIFNFNGTGPNIEHRLSVAGKTSQITKSDLIEFGKLNDIKNASAIIEWVSDSIKHFSQYASKYGITQPWQGIIQKALNENLISFGYDIAVGEDAKTLYDKNGREISKLNISINSKRNYVVTAIIDGQSHRRFIRPNMKLYAELSTKDVFNLPDPYKIFLAEELF